MAPARFTKLELQVMEALWTEGPLAVRQVQERFPEKKRPAYTTIQTVLCRLETKKAVRRTRKIGNAHIFEATTSRAATRGRLIDEVIGLIGGRVEPMMVHLIETGKLTIDDVRRAERLIEEHQRKEKGP